MNLHDFVSSVRKLNPSRCSYHVQYERVLWMIVQFVKGVPCLACVFYIQPF